MKRTISVLTLTCFLVMLSGCAAVFTGGAQNVKMDSNPQKAKILIDGKDYGETPATIKLKTKKQVDITFEKEGFKPASAHLINKVNGLFIVLDVVCGLLPVVVDAVTSSWYKFDKKAVIVELEKLIP